MATYKVITKPAHSDLTTAAAVVAFMNDGNAESPQLIALVTAASDAVVGYCKGRVFGVQQVLQTFHRDHFGFHAHSGVRHRPLILRCAPIISVDELIEDRVTLDDTAYEIDAEAGIIHALTSPGCFERRSFGTDISVTYTGGWLLPGDEGRNLPSRFETATILTVIALLRGAGRDPALRSVQTEGVGSYAYDTSAGSVVPPNARDLLTDAILEFPVS